MRGWPKPSLRKCKKAKWLSEETLQLAGKRREAKGNRERERDTQLNEEFQGIIHRYKKAFLSEQCHEIEENNRMGKTRDLFKKIGDTKGIFYISQSHSVVSDSLQPHGLYSPWNSPGWNTIMSSLSLLQRIFPTKELNPGLLHGRQILYQLSHKGSPRILEWVAYSFSRRSFQLRNWTRVSCISGGFFTNWAIREALFIGTIKDKNGKYLTKAEEIRKGDKNTQKNCTKKLLMTQITTMMLSLT